MGLSDAQRSMARRSTKDGHLRKLLTLAKSRAKKRGLPFDLDIEHLHQIATDRCPVFGTPFEWGRVGQGRSSDMPSLDRVVPELGYIRCNVSFISTLANRIKQNITERELYKVADWLHDKRKEVLRAIEGKPSPIPEAPDRAGRDDGQRGPADGAGPGQDNNVPHHYPGSLPGTEFDRRP